MLLALVSLDVAVAGVGSAAAIPYSAARTDRYVTINRLEITPACKRKRIIAGNLCWAKLCLDLQPGAANLRVGTTPVSAVINPPHAHGYRSRSASAIKRSGHVVSAVGYQPLPEGGFFGTLRVSILF